VGDGALDELASRAGRHGAGRGGGQVRGLAPEALLLRARSARTRSASTRDEPDPQTLRRWAEEAEDAARAVPGVTNSEGGSASAGRGVVALRHQPRLQRRLCGDQPRRSAQRCSPVQDSGLQRDLFLAQRAPSVRRGPPSPAAIGREAGERTVARVDPGRVKSGTYAIVLDPRVGSSLIGHLLGAMSGSAIARRASFLLDKDGAQIFDSAMRGSARIPHRLETRVPRSRPFDGRGAADRPAQSGREGPPDRLGDGLSAACRRASWA
jgi:PmbA protein